MLHPRNKLDSQAVADCKVFKVRQDTSQSPQTGEKHTFYVIEAAEWINIIPITPVKHQFPFAKLSASSL